MNKITIIISLILATSIGLGGCATVNIPEETATDEINWFPDASKVIVCSRSGLENGVIINIPPGDTRIVPFEIREGERINTFSLSAISGGGFQSFFRDSKGNFVLKSTMMPGEPDTYYLYIRNDSLTSEYCKVNLIIRFTIAAWWGTLYHGVDSSVSDTNKSIRLLKL